MKIIKFIKTLLLAPIIPLIGAGYLGCGATLKFGTTNTISEIINVAGPGYDSDDVETTTHNNTTRFREYIKGLTDAGLLDISGYVTSTELTVLESMAATTTIYSVTVTMPTGPSVSKFEANGFVKSLKLEAPVDDVISYTLGIKITGKPTFTKV
jgi:predicted secreted protein